MGRTIGLVILYYAATVIAVISTVALAQNSTHFLVKNDYRYSAETATKRIRYTLLYSSAISSRHAERAPSRCSHSISLMIEKWRVSWGFSKRSTANLPFPM